MLDQQQMYDCGAVSLAAPAPYAQAGELWNVSWAQLQVLGEVGGRRGGGGADLVRPGGGVPVHGCVGALQGIPPRTAAPMQPPNRP